MSLDVYLTTKYPVEKEFYSGIFIRQGGETREISEDEWNSLHPGTEPVRVDIPEVAETNEVFNYNITHNLGEMAGKVIVKSGPDVFTITLYEVLWRPEEIGATLAEHLIEPLEIGLGLLEADPDYYKQFNPSNGWGNYEGLVRFVTRYLVACRENPEADVRVSR
jgi:hypothetical protein